MLEKHIAGRLSADSSPSGEGVSCQLSEDIPDFLEAEFADLSGGEVFDEEIAG